MSLLHCLGVGTVTQTKETNTDTIMVYCPFLFPTAEGRTVNNVQQVEQTSLNAKGEEVKSNNLRSNSVPAKWMNLGDNNRITSPNVREGSQVAIYNVDGGNQLYWTTHGVNAETYRLESVLYGWASNPNLAENTPFDVDNFYTAKVSTHDGIFALRTSMSNGEKSKFDVQVDGMNGRVSVGGFNKGLFVLDDVESSLTYSNKEGSVARVVKKQAFIKTEDMIGFFAAETLNIKTKVIQVQADLAKIDIKKTQWLGDIEHTGNTEQTGDYTQEGDFTQVGDYTQEGNTIRDGNSTSTGIVTGLEDVIAPPISLRFHLTTGVRGGTDTSGPPTPA